MFSIPRFMGRRSRQQSQQQCGCPLRHSCRRWSTKINDQSIEKAIIEYWYRTELLDDFTDPQQKSNTRGQLCLIFGSSFIHCVSVTPFIEPQTLAATKKKVPKKILEEYHSKALCELTYIMCKANRWLDKPPQKLASAVHALHKLGGLGPLERTLPCYDILGGQTFYEVVAPLKKGSSSDAYRKRMSQRYHKIFASSACCIIRAIANTNKWPDEILNGYVLRQELSKLFGLTVTTQNARNQSCLIRKRMFDVEMFRGVLSRAVGLPEISKIKNRDDVDSIFRRENDHALPSIVQRLTPLKLFNESFKTDSYPTDTQITTSAEATDDFDMGGAYPTTNMYGEQLIQMPPVQPIPPPVEQDTHMFGVPFHGSLMAMDMGLSAYGFYDDCTYGGGGIAPPDPNVFQTQAIGVDEFGAASGMPRIDTTVASAMDVDEDERFPEDVHRHEHQPPVEHMYDPYMDMYATTWLR